MMTDLAIFLQRENQKLKEENERLKQEAVKHD